MKPENIGKILFILAGIGMIGGITTVLMFEDNIIQFVSLMVMTFSIVFLVIHLSKYELLNVAKHEGKK